MAADFSGKVGFSIGTGRCGTLFLAEAMAQLPGVSSVHERNPENETFHRYCQWYNLPVDDAGFVAVKQAEIAEDLSKASYSFESSAYVSLSLKTLHENFGARFVLMVRRPERVINSYIQKGWYANEYQVGNPNLALGYQQMRFTHHFLGRTVPKGDFYSTWKEYTQVGKLAWFWETLNREVMRQFAELPPEACRVQRLEDLNVHSFGEICEFLGLSERLSPEAYRKLETAKPNKAPRKKPTVLEWEPKAIEEFERHTQGLAEELGYTWQVEALQEEERRKPQPNVKPTAKQRLKKWLKP